MKNEELLTRLKQEIEAINEKLNDLNDNIYEAGWLHGKLSGLNLALEIAIREG